MNSKDEIWRPVPGYDGLYEVSDMGRVRSLPRAWLSRYSVNTFPGRVLSPATKQNGYLVVSLSMDNKAKQFLVHRIVLEAFVGSCPAGQEACHGNGVRADCRLSNLRWDTRSSNHADKHVHGTAQVGERGSNAKLTEAVVREIRRRKLRPIEAVREFGLSRTNAKHIVAGTTWRHVHAESE